jgi:hypothetical protein
MQRRHAKRLHVLHGSLGDLGHQHRAFPSREDEVFAEGFVEHTLFACAVFRKFVLVK